MNKGSKLSRVAVGSNQLQEHSVAIRASHQQLTHLIFDLLYKKAPQNISTKHLSLASSAMILRIAHLTWRCERRGESWHEAGAEGDHEQSSLPDPNILKCSQ